MTGEGEHRAPAARAGDTLRDAREAEGMSLDEVAARTRVPIRHLRMIEQGDYAGLPAATYSAGFVKSYARLLGLDAQALSDRFRGEIERETVRPYRPEPYEPADPRRTPPWGVAALALAAALLAALVFLYWRGSSDQPAALAANGVPAAPIAAAPAPAATQAAAAPAPGAPAAAGGPVTVGATQDVWVKVSASGKTLFMGLLSPGRTVAVPPDAVDPTLTTGRPGVTTVSVGATAIPPVGDPDRAAHGVSLKPADLLARAGAAPPAVQPASGAPTAVQDAAGPG